MIHSLIDGTWHSSEYLMEALQISDTQIKSPEVISVVGGGGKTTLILQLQREHQGKGICHVVTTTTHMQYENNGSFLEEESLESFFRVCQKEGTVVLGVPVKKGKMKGVNPEFLQELYRRGVTLLIEADGAKHLPVKIPAAHEPVILPESTIVVNVYGCDGLKMPIKEVCFRKELITAFLGKTEDALLEEADIEMLAISEAAGKKGVPKSAKYHVVLNKCDLVSDLYTVRQLAERIHAKTGSPVHLRGEDGKTTDLQ